MSCLVVVVPLREDAYESARQLLAQGPPFDLEATRFEAHSVYLTRHEAVFVFEGEHGTLGLHAEDPALWRAAGAWRRLLAARPRVAHTEFAWRRAAVRDDVSWEPTPGPGDSDGGDVYAPPS